MIGANPHKPLRSRLQSWFPVVYNKRSQLVRARGLRKGRHIVLIPLEDLDSSNGLSRWENGPSQLKRGEWAQFSGDAEHEFGVAENYGLAVILEFDMQ